MAVLEANKKPEPKPVESVEETEVFIFIFSSDLLSAQV